MEHWIYTFKIAGHALSVNMDTLLTMWLTMILLIVIAFITTRKTSIIPTKLQIIGEGIVNYFANITKASMGESEAKKHMPLILTLFMFILTANLVGQLPWHLIHLKKQA